MVAEDDTLQLHSFLCKTRRVKLSHRDGQARGVLITPSQKHRTVCSTLSMKVKPFRITNLFVSLSKMRSSMRQHRCNRLVRHDDLSMPEACTLDEWKYERTEFLSANPLPKPHEHCTQQAIDEYWKQISDLFESMLRAAHSHFSNSFAKPRMSHKKGTLKFSKGFPQGKN